MPGFKRARGKPKRKNGEKRSKVGGLLTGGKSLAKLPGKRPLIDLPGQKTLLARTLFTKMYWSVWDYMVAAASSTTYHSIRLNSIYDPGYSWTFGTKNTSSRGYSIISPLYVYYRVYSVKAFVRIWNTANCDMLVQLSTNLNSTPSNATDVDLVQRQESSLSRILSRTAAGNKNSECEFAVEIPINKVMGLTKEQFRTEADTESAMGANPGAVAYLHIQGWNIHQGGYVAGSADETNVPQFGDGSAEITTTSGGMGYSVRLVQSVQLIQAKNATAA